MTEQAHPMFVYGTLLVGESAHHLLAPHLKRTLPATTPDADLYSMGPFPMLVNGAGEVHGELCWIETTAYDEMLQLLDRYEGPDYARELRTVQAVGMEAVQAWVYVGRSKPSSADQLPGGNWRQR